MKDFISREEVCDYIAEFINNPYSTQDECEMVDAMINGIQHMPSVKPQEPIWIPVSERLPEDDTPVLICGSRWDTAQIGMYDPNKERWYWLAESCEDYWHNLMNGGVDAWMPLPKPYREEEDRSLTEE